MYWQGRGFSEVRLSYQEISSLEPGLMIRSAGSRITGAQGFRENSVIMDTDWMRRRKNRNPPSAEKDTDTG